ncbi:MAG: AAA family ATPase [Hyphomicrobiaceae bacterium]
MHLSKISIENFKGLRSASFDPTRFSCLVGENNAGKSTVLQAIVTGLKRPNQLEAELFYDQQQPVEFRMEYLDIQDADINRLAEEHRPRIQELVVDGRLVLTIRYRVGQKVEIRIERQQPREERYRDDAINAVFANKRGAAVRRALEESYAEFAGDAPDELNIGAAKAHIKEHISRLPQDQFEAVEAPLPTGVSASVTALLPEPIYIPAVKNLSDDLKTSQSTSFGRLLGLLLDDMAPDLADITASLAQLNQFFNREERDGETVDNRHEKVRDLEASVEGYLKENFPLVKIELRVPPPELRTILNSAQIYVDDGSKDVIDNKGDGIKRSLTFALLQCYVARLQGQDAEGEPATRPPLIFLFEEPELYLHPKSQRILFSTLERISRQFQVVVTTHSPLFFAPGATASFVRVAKEAADPKPIGRLRAVNFELDAASAESFKMARFENADAAFFSKRVVLFEGESDDAFFKHVAKLMNPEWDFEAKNISMVRVSGKGNFTRFRRFFEAFGIDVKLIADLDAFFEGYQHLGAGQEVTALRDEAIRLVDERIGALNIKADPANRQIKDKVSGASWRDRYNRAKDALRTIQETGNVDDDTIALMDGLFTWEVDIARVRVCRDDAASQAAIVPALTELRRSGIHVLSRGAIEDYYPEGTPTSTAKPERALAACGRVATREQAIGLSTPLGDGGDPELVVICGSLFEGI